MENEQSSSLRSRIHVSTPVTKRNGGFSFLVGSCFKRALSSSPQEATSSQKSELSILSSASTQASDDDYEDTSSSFLHSNQQFWKNAVPNEDDDERAKRQYVLEVSKRLNLTRRDLANRSGVSDSDFKMMNYWLRGKMGHIPEVEEAGELIYAYAKSVDSRVAVPFSEEDITLLHIHHNLMSLAKDPATAAAPHPSSNSNINNNSDNSNNKRLKTDTKEEGHIESTLKY